MGNVTMKEQLHLSESEAQLLRGLCYARMVVLKAGDPKGVEDLPLNYVLDEHTARMALTVFDFYRSVFYQNEEAVKRLSAVYQDPNAGGGYYDGMIGDYLHILSGLGIAEDDALVLYHSIKGYIQSQKSPPPCNKESFRPMIDLRKQSAECLYTERSREECPLGKT